MLVAHHRRYDRCIEAGVPILDASAPRPDDEASPPSWKPKRVDLGPTIVLDEERCILCRRCTRF